MDIDFSILRCRAIFQPNWQYLELGESHILRSNLGFKIDFPVRQI
jgi:hypothetical protein